MKLIKKSKLTTSTNPFLNEEDDLESEASSNRRNRRDVTAVDEDPESPFEGNLFPEVEQSREKSRAKFKDFLVFSKGMRLTYALIFCLLIAFVVPFLVNKYAFQEVEVAEVRRGACNVREGVRTNCFPDQQVVTAVECNNRGCCYQPLNLDIGAPICHHTIPSAHSLNLTGPSTEYPSAWDLSVAFNDIQWLPYLKADQTLDPLGGKYPNPGYMERQIASGHVGLLFYDRDEDQLPVDIGENAALEDISVQLQYPEATDQRLSFRVTRNDTLLFDCSLGSLILGETLSEISFLLPSNYVYGLGGHEFSFLGNSSFTTRTLYNVDPTKMSNQQHSHPIFFARDSNRDFFAIHVESQTPIEIDVLPGLNGTQETPLVVFRSMGGHMLIHLFTQPDPKDILATMTRDRRPSVPPVWAFGFHICRETQREDDFLTSFRNMTNLPYDSECIDKSLFPSAFELSNAGYGDLASLIQMLQEEEKEFIIHHPVQVEVGSEAHGQGQGSFITEDGSSEFRGTYNNLEVTLPDFTEPSTSAWWQASFQKLTTDTLRDSPSGCVLTRNSPYVEPGTCNNLTLDYPYVPGDIRNGFGRYSVCPNAVHKNGDHLSLHNSYAIRQLQATGSVSSLKYSFSEHSSPGIAPFGGVLGTHFQSTWENMRKSLKEVIELGLYGVPMVSMPACGHNVSATSTEIDSELCLRWYQIAAFMPALHNQRADNEDNLLPYNLAGTYREWIKRAIDRRYRLIPVFHTLIYEAARTGLPIIRPLFLEFPQDQNVYTIYEQFMVGDSILISPVLNDSISTQLEAYFPYSTWYELWSGQKVLGTGEGKTLEDIPYQIASHIRAGKILPTLAHTNLTIKQSYQFSNFSLIVAMGCDVSIKTLEVCTAEGEMALPQDMSEADPILKISAVNTPASGHVELIMENEWQGCSMPIEDQDGFGSIIEGMVIYGMEQKPSNITLSYGQSMEVGTDLNSEAFYETDMKMLQVTGLVLDFCEEDSLRMSWEF